MKIGIFTPYLDSMSGGEKYMLKAAVCLSAHNEVSLFWDPGQASAILQKAKEKFNYDLQYIRFVPNIFSPRISFFSRYFSSRAYEKIFYLSDGSIPLIASQLYVHFQFPVEWVKSSIKTKVKVHRVNKIICNSFFTKSFIDKKFVVDSAVLYPPAHVELINGSKKENLILHVGRFGLDKEGVNFKKQDVMIDAFKRLIDSGLTLWKFALVISFRDIEQQFVDGLKKRAENYPILFIENPNNSKLSELYGKTKIYWHATGYGEDLILHPEKAEHFGISTVEAMAHRAVPVVVNAGGQKEIVDDGKNGYVWNTLDELIQKTRALSQDPDLLVKLAENAAVAATRFSEERFCNELNVLLGIQ